MVDTSNEKDWRKAVFREAVESRKRELAEKEKPKKFVFKKIVRAVTPSKGPFVKKQAGHSVAPTNTGGRPRGSFKLRFNPITGQAVGRLPAEQWQRIKRRILAQARAVQQTRLARLQVQMTAKGVPPRFQEQAIAQRRQMAISQAVMPQRMRVIQSNTGRVMGSPQMPYNQRFPLRQVNPRPVERFVAQRDRFTQVRDRFHSQPAKIPLANKNLVMTQYGLMKVETDLMSGRKRLIPARQVLY